MSQHCVRKRKKRGPCASFPGGPRELSRRPRLGLLVAPILELVGGPVEKSKGRGKILPGKTHAFVQPKHTPLLPTRTAALSFCVCVGRPPFIPLHPPFAHLPRHPPRAFRRRQGTRPSMNVLNSNESASLRRVGRPSTAPTTPPRCAPPCTTPCDGSMGVAGSLAAVGACVRSGRNLTFNHSSCHLACSMGGRVGLWGRVDGPPGGPPPRPP